MNDKPDTHTEAEEDAIAEVLRMSDELTRETKSSTLWWAKRIAFVVACVGMLILITLFPYILMNKTGDYPIGTVLFAAFLITAGIGGVFWVQVLEKREKRDHFDSF